MSIIRTRFLAAALAALLLISGPGVASAGDELAREIFRELVEIPSTPGSPEIARANHAMADRLLAAGFAAADVKVMGFEPELANLVVRYRGGDSELRPVLLLAHMDVVDVDRSRWLTEPFRLVEQDGFFYGRGTTDNKPAIAAIIANFVRLHEEGFTPERDLIFVITADEETTGASIEWLLEEHRPLIDAEFAFNSDASHIFVEDGRPTAFGLQASEKVYMTLAFEATNGGGHSSRPRSDNAIYDIAAAMTRLADYRFPVQTSEITRGFFARSAELRSGRKAMAMSKLASDRASEDDLALLEADDYLNALMRTTCVATRLEAGHANNALPVTARAIVNCRVLPEDSTDEVQQTLLRIIDDDSITMSMVWAPVPSPPSPLKPEIMGRVATAVTEVFGNLPVVPVMSTGATDGLYLRNAGIPTYGFSALAEDPDGWRSHGANERLGVQAFYDSVEFWDRLIKGL